MLHRARSWSPSCSTYDGAHCSLAARPAGTQIDVRARWAGVRLSSLRAERVASVSIRSKDSEGDIVCADFVSMFRAFPQGLMDCCLGSSCTLEESAWNLTAVTFSHAA